MPQTGAVSLRAFNRNFEGRCGAPGINVYLASPVTCAAAAIAGKVVDPREITDAPSRIRLPRAYADRRPDDHPAGRRRLEAEIRRGPNIKPIPTRAPMAPTISGQVITRVGDNISTDGILPAHAHILALRSNVPAISELRVQAGRSDLRGAGQGDGRRLHRRRPELRPGIEPRARRAGPSYLGVKAVIAKSFARIHRANLTNFGVLPLTLVNEDDYDLLDPDDVLEIGDARGLVGSGENEIPVQNVTKGKTIITRVEASDRQRVHAAGGRAAQLGARRTGRTGTPAGKVSVPLSATS